MTGAATSPAPGVLRDPCFDPDPAARARAAESEAPAQRAVRSRFGLRDDVEALRRFARAHRAPEWVRGTITLADAVFLFEMVRAVRPARVIEIGAGSGCSTAVILRGLAEIGGPARDGRGVERVQSFDTCAHCFFDDGRPVGSALGEMAPELAGGARLHVGMGAAEAGEMFTDEPVALAFIDADHRHPAPTADVLLLAPALTPGAWIVLHDIDLEQHGRNYTRRTGVKVDWSAHGAEWLFRRWPFEKIAGAGGAYNIGAIRMPRRAGLSADDLRELIDLPWECEMPERARAALGRT